MSEVGLVPLGTDWSPTGSRNLLVEPKIADIVLRDSTLLGASPARSCLGQGL
jgi:hypothetical protein